MGRVSIIDILLDREMLKSGVEHYHELPLKSASWLVFGPSNSGKSTLVKVIVGRLALYTDARVTILDGKSDDYTFLRGVQNARHYEFSEIADGLTAFYAEFEDRLSGNSDRTPLVVVIEEWGSYLRKMEASKETAQAAKTSLSQVFSIVSQGRSYNVHALFSVQRPDASLFTGFRESLTVVCGLGRISPESAKMAGFTDYDSFNNSDCRQGAGWYLTESTGLAAVQVPVVRNWQKLNEDIKAAVTR
jgi:AAA+ ATPase superfamily predicted ATPase